MDANKIPGQLRRSTSVLYWSVNNWPQAPTLKPFEIMMGVHNSLWSSIRKNKRKELGRAERRKGQRERKRGRENKRGKERRERWKGRREEGRRKERMRKREGEVRVKWKEEGKGEKQRKAGRS